MDFVELSGLMADRRYPDPGFNINYLALFLATHGQLSLGLATAVAEAQARLADWVYGVTVPDDAEHFLREFRQWAANQRLTAGTELAPRGGELVRHLGQRRSALLGPTDAVGVVQRYQRERFEPYRREHLGRAQAALRDGDLGGALASAVEGRRFDPHNASSASIVEQVRRLISGSLPQIPSEDVTDNVVEAIQPIEGWFSDAEARVLARCVAAAPHNPAKLVVEIGSYKGRSTVVMGLTAKRLGLPLRIVTIDPHIGYPFGDKSDTYDTLMANLVQFDLLDRITAKQARSLEVRVDEPIALAFVDGLHDPRSVAADVGHVLGSITPGGLIALHDYIDHFPGVIAAARNLLEDPRFEPVAMEDRLLVLRKREMA